MTLLRSAVLLAGALIVMLSVIMLRTETTRTNYRISRFDQQADALRQQLRDEELKLQRLRNPALIRAKAKELKLPMLEPEAPPTKPLPPAPKKRKP